MAMSTVKPWHRLPCGLPIPGNPQSQVWNNLVQCSVFLPMAGNLELDDLGGPSQLKPPHNSTTLCICDLVNSELVTLKEKVKSGCAQDGVM